MKSGLDLGSFEVHELSNNIKFQQWRICLHINRGFFMKHNLIWARRSWENHSSSTVMWSSCFKKSVREVPLPLVFRPAWEAACGLEPGLHTLIPPLQCLQCLLLRKGISPLFFVDAVTYQLFRGQISNIFTQGGCNQRVRNGENVKIAEEFVYLGRFSHRKALPVLKVLI